MVAGIIFDRTTACWTPVNLDEKKRDVITWVHELDHFLDACGFSSDGQNPSHMSSSDLVDLLICLNEWIESSSGALRSIFYQAAEQAGLDRVFEKLQRISKSVRCAKEIEEYEDVREEWEDQSQKKGHAVKHQTTLFSIAF